VHRALADEPLEVHNDGRQTRSFCDVDDCVRGLMLLMDTPSTVGQVFNVGNGESVTIGALAEAVRDRCGSCSSIVNIPYEEAYGSGFEDMLHRRPALDKIKAATGWEPLIPLPEALDRIIAAERAAGRAAALRA
jgi:UDP-glucose 4-epimerase